MKKLILSLVTILLLVSSSIVAAEHELDKGAISASGNMYYHNQFGDAVVNRQLFIADINFDYAVKPGLFIGGDIYSYVNNKDDDSWWVGPIITYYFNADKRENQFNQLFPFIDAYYVYGNESHLKRSMLGLQTGLLVFVSKEIGIDFLVSFEKTYYHYGSDYKTGTGYQIFTGFGLSSFIF